MSPAGAGIARYRPREHRTAAWAILAAATLLTTILLSSGGSAHASTSAPAVAALPGRGQFQAACEQGPSPGQGNTGESCVCWEANLEAAAIMPGYAVDALNAAQVGGGPAYTVPQNLAGGLLGPAIYGCAPY